MISVVGYGSLLSERSARETVPGLKNFRLVSVPGYKRIFNKVGVVFIARHGALPTSQCIASCSTQLDPAVDIICSQFECSEAEFAELYEREHRFRWIEVDTVSFSGETTRGRMCTFFTDHDYRLNKCITESEYQRRVGRFYQGQLWRDDILPFPRYLAFCLQAAESQGSEVLDNFLDTSFLADGVTSIRDYIGSTPELNDWRSVDTGYRYVVADADKTE